MFIFVCVCEASSLLSTSSRHSLGSSLFGFILPITLHFLSGIFGESTFFEKRVGGIFCICIQILLHLLKEEAAI